MCSLAAQSLSSLSLFSPTASNESSERHIMSTEPRMDSRIPAESERPVLEQHLVEESFAEVVDTDQTHTDSFFATDLTKELYTRTGDLWTIIIHNDAVTPYDFVIHILGDLFLLSEELADHVAWTAHTKGEAVVVVRPRSEAEKLVKVAHGRARLVSYPLTFTVEQD
jgi:ATP-dependent Clp protease adaptor protein ClpS